MYLLSPVFEELQPTYYVTSANDNAFRAITPITNLEYFHPVQAGANVGNREQWSDFVSVELPTNICVWFRTGGRLCVFPLNIASDVLLKTSSWGHRFISSDEIE